jgi:hypothetical protein
MSRELWERVQAKLCGHAVRDGEGRKTAAMRSPLAGKLFDANGEPLYVQGAVKGQRHYRYYVSKRLVRGEPQEPEQRWRLSAAEIERAVSAGARTMLGDRAAIARGRCVEIVRNLTPPRRLHRNANCRRCLQIQRLSGHHLALSTARLYVREKLDLWRQDYNQVRPHSALDDNAPAAFAAQWAETAQPARIQFQTGGESPQWALHWRYLLESVECINGQRFRPCYFCGAGQCVTDSTSNRSCFRGRKQSFRFGVVG